MDAKIIYSNRKSVAIRIKPDLTIEVRAPRGMPQREIDKILAEKKNWIKKHMQMIKEKEGQKNTVPKLSEEEIRELADQALAYIPKRVEYFAPVIGVDYRTIAIRNQKTRWGSCSAKGGLNFNCLLMLAPPEIIDYVVVHELCHRKEMNHSRKFWEEVEHVLPEYKKSVRWLKDNGSVLMRRMHG